ncbi:MAG: hypothetical protein ABI868_22450 [Acidobacteriota bacterium]
MHRTIALLIVLMATTVSVAAERQWQTGTWGDVTTRRKLIDFGPGASPFGRGATKPSMRAMADIRNFVIETDALRIEMEDTVPVGRRSIDPIVGTAVTFALEKKSVFVRDADGREHKLRLTKKIERQP